MPSEANIINFILYDILLTEMPTNKKHQSTICYCTQWYDYSIFDICTKA